MTSRLARLAALALLAAPAGARPAAYASDGRVPVEELYRFIDGAARRGGWLGETVYVDEGLPIKLLRTRRKGPALWLLAGMHGEEPAPPNALRAHPEALRELDARGIPAVVIPLCNPVGYVKNWRYPDAARLSKTAPGHSVGDSEHRLLSKDGTPRLPSASSAQAAALTGRVLALARDYPPVLWLNLHEDDELEKGYLYSQGPLGARDPAARAVLAKMRELGYPTAETEPAGEEERIVDGVISGVEDGSIDELAAARTVWAGGKAGPGPAGRSVIVAETSSRGAPLSERVRVHSALLGMLPELFELAKRGEAARPER